MASSTGFPSDFFDLLIRIFGSTKFALKLSRLTYNVYILISFF